MQLLDGKALATQIKQDLQNKIESISGVRRPSLAIFLTADDFASKKYVELKRRVGQEIGIDVEVLNVQDKAREDIISLIRSRSESEKVDGLMIQLPLRNDLSETELLSLIPVGKDVDGLSPATLGKLFHGHDNVFVSATPLGITLLLDKYKIDVNHKHVVFVGWNKFIGMPLSAVLMHKGATFTVTHRKTVDIQSFTRQADILISATGVCKLIKKDFVAQDAIVIDVGFSRDNDGKICGDVDFDNVQEKCSFITPVPGGVGPMTVVSLMKNTVTAWLNNLDT